MTWTVELADPRRSGLNREYLTEICDRYYGRPATTEEVDHEMFRTAEDLPVFVEARWDGTPVGCLGMRLLEPSLGELTRMFVRTTHRGRGGGGVLLAAVERAACAVGVRRIRLDTRSDLVEARALYAKHGYVEIPAYKQDPYAEHFFEKWLDQACYIPLTGWKSAT